MTRPGRRLLTADPRSIERYIEDRPNAPVLLPEYTVATLPDPAAYRSGTINVTDETGGYAQAFSDGSAWRRSTDRAVVS